MSRMDVPHSDDDKTPPEMSGDAADQAGTHHPAPESAHQAGCPARVGTGTCTCAVTQGERIAAVDDPEWVLAMYRKAKELIVDLREENLPPEWRDRVEEFYVETFMDTCTTLGPDCGCSRS